MRGRWLACWAIASVVLACSPAPPPTPSSAPPAIPADIVPWPDLVWNTADGVASADPGDGEQAVAVTVGPQGFVAVGYRDEGDTRDGLAWFSADGKHWARVGAKGTFDAVEMLDVTAGPGGFVALGIGASHCLRCGGDGSLSGRSRRWCWRAHRHPRRPPRHPLQSSRRMSFPGPTSCGRRPMASHRRIPAMENKRSP